MYILSTNKRNKNINACLASFEMILSDIDISQLPVNYWFFQWIDLMGPFNFGQDHQTVTQETQSKPKGRRVSLEEFDRFLQGDSQIIDGSLVAINLHNESMPVFVLDCFDASLWVIATTSREIGERLLHSGWNVAKHFPRCIGFDFWVKNFKEYAEKNGLDITFD